REYWLLSLFRAAISSPPTPPLTNGRPCSVVPRSIAPAGCSSQANANIHASCFMFDSFLNNGSTFDAGDFRAFDAQTQHQSLLVENERICRILQRGRRKILGNPLVDNHHR